jgi:putative FmdB family regulatory protein
LPTYEYRCDACGATYELFQKMSDPPLETCEACGSPVRKVLYPVAVHFKGSGFYTTDYGRSGSGRKTGKGSDEGERASESDTSGSGAKGDGDGKASGDKAADPSSSKGSGDRPKEKQPAG